MDLNSSIIYEIYPTSFNDFNGDGIGDIVGITEKLEYVKKLGADIVWINPIYKSPFKDGGYDVEDYYSIDGKFGDFNDFEKMIKKAHDLDLKIMMDLVIGHTSDRHKWFLESKKEKRNKYSDYYVWTNNVFTGGNNTIKGMAKRNGNYVVNYYSFQPALNYGYNKPKTSKNNDVWNSDEWQIDYKDKSLYPLKQEILNIIYFWMDKGVDGFRVDLANSLIKGGYDVEALKWLWSYFIGSAKAKNPDVIFMSEWGNPVDATYCGFDIDYFSHCSVGYNQLFRGEKGSNIMPAFECGNSYFSENGKGSIGEFIKYAKLVSDKMNGKGYYSVPTGYHDIIRIATNKSSDLMKCIYAFLLTYKNLPMIYYGDEIGIKHNFKINKDGGYIRTGARTPMQWNNGKNRGFSVTDKRLYLPVGKEKAICVEEQEQDENSLLNFVKEMIKIKKKYDCFDFDASVEIDDNVVYPLRYVRCKGREKMLVIINPTDSEYQVEDKIKEIVLQRNTDVKEKIILKKCSVLIAKI